MNQMAIEVIDVFHILLIHLSIKPGRDCESCQIGILIEEHLHFRCDTNWLEQYDSCTIKNII